MKKVIVSADESMSASDEIIDILDTLQDNMSLEKLVYLIVDYVDEQALLEGLRQIKEDWL